MKITKVTITGTDDKVPIVELIKLSQEFPFVEWGILFSKSKEGQSRYPSKEWIKKFTTSKMFSEVNTSAHLCGQYPRDILQQGDHAIFEFLDRKFDRAQLNFNFANTFADFQHIISVLNNPFGMGIILQYNKANSEIVKELIENKYSFDILYDSSGGRGTEIKEINSPFKGYYTGYSGGLNPENIKPVLEKITENNSTAKVFIDCESGVRTNDEFDLVKVRKYLEICSEFVMKTEKVE